MTLASVTPAQLGFPHAATVVAVRSAVTDKKTGLMSGQTRLFVCSLERPALTSRQWLARCRGHWSVESANHYRRDVTWREDAETRSQRPAGLQSRATALRPAGRAPA